MTNLTTLGIDGNPLTSLIISEPLAASNMANTVAAASMRWYIFQDLKQLFDVLWRAAQYCLIAANHNWPLD